MTDQATLSTGLSTDTHTEDHAIPIFIIPAPDPVFTADNAGPVDLHLSHIPAGSTASVTAEPDNGSLLLADGTSVHNGATLTSAELAGLTFVPKDVSGEASSFTVSDGATSSFQNISIHVADGAAGGVILTGTEDKDVLAGGPGHDILDGNGGTDFMTGGGGADTFVFNQVPQQNATLTHVTDYSAAQGDIFDFSALT